MKIDGIDIGSRIRSLRKRKRLSLNQLAALTGIAASNLSSIELNKTSPTLGTLAKIASAFEVRTSSLVEEIFYEKVVLCLPENDYPAANDSRHAMKQLLTGKMTMNSMDVTCIYLEAESEVKSDEAVERFIYCLDGQMQAIIDDVTYYIRKNSGLYLMPEVSAVLKSASNVTAQALMIFQANAK